MVTIHANAIEQTPKRYVFPRDWLCAQNMLTILHSIVNMNRGTCMTT